MRQLEPTVYRPEPPVVRSAEEARPPALTRQAVTFPPVATPGSMPPEMTPRSTRPDLDRAGPSPCPTEVVVRAADVADRPAIQRIFREALTRGRPLALPPLSVEAYERIDLGWYLDRGTVLVAEARGTIVGCLLVCLDRSSLRRWRYRAAARWLARNAWWLATRRTAEPERRFVRAVVADGWSHWVAAPGPFAAHALVLVGDRGGRQVGRRLIAMMEDLAAAAGHRGWELLLDVPAGQPLSGGVAAGGHVLDRRRNRAVTHLGGRDVERLRVARRLRSVRP